MGFEAVGLDEISLPPCDDGFGFGADASCLAIASCLGRTEFGIDTALDSNAGLENPSEAIIESSRYPNQRHATANKNDKNHGSQPPER